MNPKSTDFSRFVSVQPFWQAEKKNRELLYDKNNGNPIAVVYELETQPEQTGLSCVPGIGLLGILFSLDENDPRAICCGALNQSKNVPLFGMHHVLSCQFFPGEFTRIFGVPGSELADAEVPLDDILHVGSVPEEIAAAPTFAERINCARSFINTWENRTKVHDSGILTQKMMHDVLLSHGDLRMSELEDQTGYSARYLQKIILENVGLTPKTALANIRFQSALRMMLEQPRLSIAEVAQSAGYYDQSHFSKVFKEYTGITPLAFQERFKNYLFRLDAPPAQK